jgi:hypothetical protein
MVPAALMPLAGQCQVAPDTGVAPAERAEVSYKYEAYAGYGYTSLNQVNASRYGLQGVNLAITRDWGRYFGLTADGAAYLSSFEAGNPGDPKVDLVLFGPVVHANIYGKVDGFFRGLLGGEHTAGESEVPNISFAGGLGGGLDYALSPRLKIRASGDDIASSFVEDPNHQGYSPHKRWNSRAGIGIVYKF